MYAMVAVYFWNMLPGLLVLLLFDVAKYYAGYMMELIFYWYSLLKGICLIPVIN